MRILTFIYFLFFSLNLLGQVNQTQRFELKKKNNDDFFTVLPAGKDGVIIFRDTNDYKKGDVWQIVVLDTLLNESWDTEVLIDSKYVFKGYDLTNSKLHLLFRDGEYEKRDYHLISVNIKDGEIERFDIKNEVPLELSHITMLPDRLVLAGYVNFSPTLVSYKLGEESFEIIPGFFKDRSNVVDLRDNGNSTFNTVTLEKDYKGTLLRLRTYSYDGEMLFEREVLADEKYKLLGAKSSGFINGNLVIAGTYSINRSNYAVGIFFIIVKPEGQENVVKYYDFSNFEHFFDYMKPKRAARIKAKLESKVAQGKEFHFPSRLLLHEIRPSNNGYLLAGEIFDPNYVSVNSRPGFDDGFASQRELERRRRAAHNYAKQPSKLQNVNDADHFDYLESIVFELDSKGNLLWDNSMKIEEIKTLSLEQIVHLSVYDLDEIRMVYKTDEDLYYKSFQKSETVEESNSPILLKNESDKIIHTYEGVGRSEYWYDNHFIIWGYHKIEDGLEPSSKSKRSVLYVNKVEFE